jgi:uncharacterized membrane protein
LKKILRFLLGVSLFVGGEYLGYEVFINYNQNSLLGIVGILAVVMSFGGMFLIIETPILFLANLCDEYKNKNKLTHFILFIPMIIMAISLFALPVIVYTHYSEKYHKEQIDKYGVIQNIIIDNESHGKNSNNYSDFSFYHNGIEWRGSLRTWNYRLGDSAKIIYSSENPNEVEWFEKYIKTKK